MGIVMLLLLVAIKHPDMIGMIGHLASSLPILASRARRPGADEEEWKRLGDLAGRSNLVGCFHAFPGSPCPVYDYETIIRENQAK